MPSGSSIDAKHQIKRKFNPKLKENIFSTSKETKDTKLFACGKYGLGTIAGVWLSIPFFTLYTSLYPYKNERSLGVFVHVLGVAGIDNDDGIDLDDICKIPLVCVCHTIACPPLKDGFAPR